MPGHSDFDFQNPTPGMPPTGFGKRKLPPIPAVIAVVVLGFGAYVWFGLPAPPAPRQQAPIDEPARPAAAAPVAVAKPPELPALDDSDTLVRERISTLSSNPVLATWLMTEDLARNLVVVLENTARGLTPSKHLAALKPVGAFRVIRERNRIILDPLNYGRFSGIVEASASIDPKVAATVYATLKPLLQVAYDELGNQESIDVALERALIGLLGAPIVEGDIPLEIGVKGVGFRFVETRLENLTGAQKQLVRMGPANMRVVQGRLRLFALAIGIQSPRLPAP